MKSIKELYLKLSVSSAVTISNFIEQKAQLILFFFGIILLYGAGANVAYAGSGTYAHACNGILSLVEGTFGALVTAIAGMAAIIASAVGGFKMAWSLLVVAVGSFILRSFITLFNGDCGGGGGGGGAIGGPALCPLCP